MTKKPLHIIYIPGLGDAKVTRQQNLVSIWRIYGVHPHLFQMKWADGEDWKPKLVRLRAQIDLLLKEGNDVAVCGASAGAAAALNVYAARKDKLAGCVLIAGKINRPENIREKLVKENPAFAQAAKEVPKAIGKLTVADRKKILSRYGFDFVVNNADSKIRGARNRHVFTVGHTVTIAVQLIFGAPSFIRFLKKQQKLKNSR